MGLIVQLVVHCAAVLVVTSLPYYPNPYYPQNNYDGWYAPPWFTSSIPRPYSSQQWDRASDMPLRWGYFCDHWCENPLNSGRRVCCEDIPPPQLRCPIDTRSPGDCNARAKRFGGRTGSRNPTANCGPVGGPSVDCPPGLFCCNGACGGPVCKHPERRQLQVSCPIDTRNQGNCLANVNNGNLSTDSTAKCGPVGGPSPKCPTGLLCCNDACAGPVCKHPKAPETIYYHHIHQKSSYLPVTKELQ